MNFNVMGFQVNELFETTKNQLEREQFSLYLKKRTNAFLFSVCGRLKISGQQKVLCSPICKSCSFFLVFQKLFS